MNEDTTLDRFVEDSDSNTAKDDSELDPKVLTGVFTGWKKTSLEEVADSREGSFVDGPFGANLLSEEYSDEGFARIIKLQNIKPGRFIDTNKKYISERKFRELERHSAYPDEIAIAKMAKPVARACILPDLEDRYILAAADVVKLATNREFSNVFVMYSLNSYPVWKQAFSRARGTGRKRINLNQLKEVQIPTPPLPEQRKIATVLYTVDRAIEKTEGTIERLNRIQKGTLRDLFENGIGGDVETRDSPMGRFPEHWELKPMQKVGSLLNGSAFPKEHQGVSEGKYPFIKVSDTNDYRRFVTGAKNHISKEIADEIGCNIHPEGTVILPKRGAAIMTNKRRIVAQQSAIDNNQIGIVGEEVQPLFLYYYLSDVDMGRFVQEGAVKSLTKSLLSKIRVPIPSPETQSKIVETLESIDERIEAEIQVKNQQERLKRGLMQDLLSGTVRTTDTKIEVPDEIAQYG